MSIPVHIHFPLLTGSSLISQVIQQLSDMHGLCCSTSSNIVPSPWVLCQSISTLDSMNCLVSLSPASQLALSRRGCPHMGGASQSESFCAFCSKALLKVISNHSESGTESVERCRQRWAKQMGQVIEILQGKGSQELITSCMMLLQSHYSYLQMSWKQQHRSSRVGGHSRGLPVL